MNNQAVGNVGLYYSCYRLSRLSPATRRELRFIHGRRIDGQLVNAGDEGGGGTAFHGGGRRLLAINVLSCHDSFLPPCQPRTAE